MDSDLNMVRYGLSRFYWGVLFYHRWANNRWPIKRANESELLTAGSEGIFSSNHDSIENQEFDG